MLSTIATLEQATSLEQVEAEALVAPLADWLERTGDPELLERFEVWIFLVLAQRFGTAEADLEFRHRHEEEGRMTTLIERSRKWGEELNQQWLEKGVEKGIHKGERELVLRMVALRFGPEAADDLAPVLAGIADADRVAASRFVAHF